jgi:FkbM family methyltransferase
MGEKFFFNKTNTAQQLVDEVFSDCYRVFQTEIKFEPGDVVLDLGACEGMFSIMIAKIFPFVKVYSYEPVTRTYHQLLRNIGLNGTTNIMPRQLAVGKKAGKMTMYISKDFSGGSSSLITYKPEDHLKEEVNVVTLEDIFNNEDIDKVKLLKIDIEGMEYEVLQYTELLDRVEYVTGEFHINRNLEYVGRRMDGLANYLSTRTKLIGVEACRMAE